MKKQYVEITRDMLVNHRLYLKDYYNDFYLPLTDSSNRRIIIDGGLISQDLISENLSRAIFTNCKFINVDFRASDLQYTGFRLCEFIRCNFDLCNCRYASFYHCNCDNKTSFNKTIMENVEFAECVFDNNKWINKLPLACPSDGEFIGWKKILVNNGNNIGIAKLLIPKDAKRVSGNGRKCRADKAIVLEIQSINGEIHYTKGLSKYNHTFIYEVGQLVEPEEKFEDNRFNVCSSGIHFFIDRNLAVDY